MLSHARHLQALLLGVALAGGCVVGSSPATAVNSVTVSAPSQSPDRGDAVTPSLGSTPASAALAGFVTGTLMIEPAGGGAPMPVVSGTVAFFNTEYPFWNQLFITTDGDGAFSTGQLNAGTYKVAFSSLGNDEQPVREWYPQARFEGEAEVVTLTEGVARDFGTIVLSPRDIELDRVQGADRFATAAAVSQSQFAAASGPEVLIVNGFDFPDALSAGPLAARGGVVLMVEPNRVPPVIADELTRLRPSRITIVGGTGVVSAAVQTRLQSFVSSPSLVTRIAGTDRYDTSRRVITDENGFDSNVSTIFIVTGQNFPDALAAVPPAIKTDAAILLVNGSANALDIATRSLLRSLAPNAVYIVGGAGAVSAGIENDIANPQNLGLGFNRYSGADRFETAVNVAVSFYPAADYAYLANAFSFPDALAAGPIAGQRNSPIYLTRPECVPDLVFVDIIDVLANRVVAVGGPGVISENAAQGVPCGSTVR